MTLSRNQIKIRKSLKCRVFVHVLKVFQNTRKQREKNLSKRCKTTGIIKSKVAMIMYQQWCLGMMSYTGWLEFL